MKKAVKGVFLGWVWPDGSHHPDPSTEDAEKMVRIIDEVLGLEKSAEDQQAG